MGKQLNGFAYIDDETLSHTLLLYKYSNIFFSYQINGVRSMLRVKNNTTGNF